MSTGPLERSRAVARREQLCKNPVVSIHDAAPQAGADLAFEPFSTLVREIWPGAALEAVTPLRGDASSREYFRLELRASVPSAPATAVAMKLGDRAVALSSEELGVYGKDGPTELPFLNVWRFLSARDGAVPDVYGKSADERLLLLEDVGDVTLWAAAENEERRRTLFERAISWLAALQRDARDDGRCYAFRQTFDKRLFAWEFEHFVEYGLASPPPTLAAEVRSELGAAAAQLAALPRVFCHRDFHAWNIHWQPGDKLRVIDFQDALLGPRLYDVASLLTDRMTPERIGPATERSLVASYAEMAGGKTKPNEEDLLAEYRTVALQRVLKVIGRFNYLAEVKGKPAYLDMLPAVATTANRLLEDLRPRFPATRRALAECGKVGAVRQSNDLEPNAS